MHLNFKDLPDENQAPPPPELFMSKDEQKAADLQIQQLLDKKAIIQTQQQLGSFYSNIFLRPKKDGSYRTILNLKQFNKSLKHIHFKMETQAHILTLIHGSF